VLRAAWIELNKQLGRILPYGLALLLHTLAGVTDPARITVGRDTSRHTTVMGVAVCMRLSQETETLLGTSAPLGCARSSSCLTVSLSPPPCRVVLQMD
jgi:hypothetical protein